MPRETGAFRRSHGQRQERTTPEVKTLEPADKVEVTVLVDNFIDSTLRSTPGISRFRDRNID